MYHRPCAYQRHTKLREGCLLSRRVSIHRSYHPLDKISYFRRCHKRHLVLYHSRPQQDIRCGAVVCSCNTGFLCVRNLLWLDYYVFVVQPLRSECIQVCMRIFTYEKIYMLPYFRDVNIITTMDYLTSLLAGLIIFGILGHLAHVMDIEDIQQVTTSFMGLAFIAYPETISKFDYIPQFFAIVFFLMLFFFCIGSNMGMASCIVTVIRDRYPKIMCWKIVLAIVVLGIVIGIFYTTPNGQYLINLLDFYGASFVALILAIIELITVSWIYGVDRFCGDIEFMLRRKTGRYWWYCWKYITPFIMISILLYFIWTWKALTYQGQEYSAIMHGM